MNRKPSADAWLLIFAAALTASAVGHASVFALGGAAGYAHVAQLPILEAAIFAGVVAIVSAMRRMFASVSASRLREADWVLTAFDGVARFGPGRLVSVVVAIQLCALVAGESVEQRVAGVTLGGVAGLFGSALGFAPLIHLVIGVAVALALRSVARFVSANVRGAVSIVRAWLASASDAAGAQAPTYAYARSAAVPSHCSPLGLKLASRPPPVSARYA